MYRIQFHVDGPFGTDKVVHARSPLRREIEYRGSTRRSVRYQLIGGNLCVV